MPLGQAGSRTKKEQWFAFQKMWLTNLRRELLGTDEHFGNPRAAEGDSSLEGLKLLLPEQPMGEGEATHPRCLVLDLDETLVHTEFNQSKGWITHRRPHVLTFLSEMAKDYELVCFTSGLKPYASPIIDHLDPGEHKLISHRLYRNHTLSMKGIHAKDLSRLNRDLARTIIIDNSPESYLLQPENAIPIKSFFGDNNDTSLLDLIPFLKDIVKEDVADVRSVLKKCHLKGRFVTDSSRQKPRAEAEGAPVKDRRVSDIGANPRPMPEDGEFCQRDRSMSDVDQLPEDMGVLWLSDGGNLLHPIVIQEDMERQSSVHGSERHLPDQCHAAKHPILHRAATGGEMGDFSLHQGVLVRAGAGDMPLHSWSHDGDASCAHAPAGSGALLDWSSVHGSFAEVLRGMSPPPWFGLTPVAAQLQDAASQSGDCVGDAALHSSLSA